MRLISLALFAAALWAFGGVHAFAQAQTRNPGESAFSVIVTDPNGAAVAGAAVTLESLSNDKRVVRTNQNGEAIFRGLAPGSYRVSVAAKGFKGSSLDQLELKGGTLRVPVRLEVSGADEKMEVKESDKEKLTDSAGDAFATVLTEKQISQLPDDPDDFKQALNNIAGPGGVIRVNGFTGGQLPPKSQIREIRINRNPYSAEFHEAGFISVDIFTKPGVGLWHGSFNFGFRDGPLNGRNAFAPVRGPEQYRRLGLDLESPIWRNHTSLFLSLQGYLSYDSKTIVAALPSGNFASLASPLTRTLNFSTRVEHALTKTHTLRAEYQRNAVLNGDLGVGNFDLEERAYSTNSVEHIFRLSDSGLLTEKAVNEIRMQARWQNSQSSSSTDAPAVLVLNAFDSGGAQVTNSKRIADYELADNLDFTTGKHAIKTGLLWQFHHYNTSDLQNAGGTFTFSSLGAFESGAPATFTQRLGSPQVIFNQYEFGWYIQDAVRIRKGLSVDLGLRDEFQSHVADISGFAPRIGLAWSPDGKLVVRAGAGIFHEWLDAGTFEQVLRDDGLHERDLVIQQPGFPTPLIGGIPLALPPGKDILDPALRLPYLEHASLGVQLSLPANLSLNMSYSYERGVHLFRGHNINAPVPGLGRPDPILGNIDQVESTGNSQTHLMIVSLNRLSERLSFFLNYVLSSSRNDTDGPLSLPANNGDLNGEWGPAANDARHRVFAYVGFNLTKALGFGTIFTANSAMPYNITTGFDNNQDTVFNDRPQGVGRNSARGVGDWNLGARVSYNFAFGKARNGPKGARVVRVTDRDDALGMLGSRSGKDGLVKLQLYLQAYNIFNHTNPMNFSGVETSPFFGLPTAAQPPRRIEMGLRVGF